MKEEEEGRLKSDEVFFCSVGGPRAEFLSIRLSEYGEKEVGHSGVIVQKVR
jgi:hypothetical protein